MKAPAFVRKWCKENEVDLGSFFYEADGDPEWDKVSDELVDEDKYNNEHAAVFEHIPTGRYVRTFYSSLPYGIDDYGMQPNDLYDIEEVFPVEVTRTEYRSKAEQKKDGAACPR